MKRLGNNFCQREALSTAVDIKNRHFGSLAGPMLRSSPKREMCCPVQTSVSVRNLCQIRSVVSEEDRQTDRETNGIFNIPNYHVGDKNSTLRHDLDVVHQRRCDTNQPGPNSSPPTLRRHHRLRGTEKKKVRRESILCGGTIHMELSARVSEKE